MLLLLLLAAFAATTAQNLYSRPGFSRSLSDYEGISEPTIGIDHPCYRPCSDEETPRVCEYYFIEEWYPTCGSACDNCTLGFLDQCLQPGCICPDGFEREILVVNRVSPSPPINVCKGDTVVVKFLVAAQGNAESIHWHGIRQKNTPFSDGVSGVTQCAILDGNTFTYVFTAEDHGTYWYHPHNGYHKANGVAGAVVVRLPKNLDPLRDLYDYDDAYHTVIISDYQHAVADNYFPGLRTSPAGQPNNNALIQGNGQYYNISTGTYTQTPLSEFVVVPGRRHRFRFIAASSLTCPMSIQIESHTLTLIAVDGMDVKPVEVDRIIVYAGERVDLVVRADQGPGLYWMHFSTRHGLCAKVGAVEQVAVLRYGPQPGGGIARTLPGSPRPSNSAVQLPAERVYGDPMSYCSPYTGSGALQVCPAQLEAALPAPLPPPFSHYPPRAPVLVTIGVNFKLYSKEELFDNTKWFHKFLVFGNISLAGALNNISFSKPPSPPVVQPGDAAPFLCSHGNLPTGQPECDTNFCECPHNVKVPSNTVVDILIVDEADLTNTSDATSAVTHPMHTHGYSPALMSMGASPEILSGQDRRRYFKDLYRAGRLPQLSRSPPQKDTFPLPVGGYVLLRIFTDNPGFWFIHCHFDFHMASGMEMILQVGETYEMVEAPDDFPRCGDYIPTIKTSRGPTVLQTRRRESRRDFWSEED